MLSAEDLAGRNRIWAAKRIVKRLSRRRLDKILIEDVIKEYMNLDEFPKKYLRYLLLEMTERMLLYVTAETVDMIIKRWRWDIEVVADLLDFGFVPSSVVASAEFLSGLQNCNLPRLKVFITLVDVYREEYSSRVAWWISNHPLEYKMLGGAKSTDVIDVISDVPVLWCCKWYNLLWYAIKLDYIFGVEQLVKRGIPIDFTATLDNISYDIWPPFLPGIIKSKTCTKDPKAMIAWLGLRFHRSLFCNLLPHETRIELYDGELYRLYGCSLPRSIIAGLVE